MKYWAKFSSILLLDRDVSLKILLLAIVGSFGMLVSGFPTIVTETEPLSGNNRLGRASGPINRIPFSGVAFGSSQLLNTNDDGTVDEQQQPSNEQQFDSSGTQLDRNSAIVCTNRHNCEITCARAKAAKFASKAALLDALAASLGEDSLTDAHKLGLQFGRRKSCDKCALIYSNCYNRLYRLAQQQLFTWRSTADDMMISLTPKKSSNTL